jgi:hypothetical protein
LQRPPCELWRALRGLPMVEGQQSTESRSLLDLSARAVVVARRGAWPDEPAAEPVVSEKPSPRLTPRPDDRT